MDNQEANIDYNQLFKLANSISKPDPSTSKAPLPYLDNNILSQDLRIMKAIIPYLDFENQKKFSILIRLIELKKTLDLYNDPNNFHLQAIEKKDFNLINILTDIKNSCDEADQKKLNMLLTLLKMQHLKDSMDAPNPNLLNNTSQVPPQQDTSDNYDGFINLLNKVINEKE